MINMLYDFNSGKVNWLGGLAGFVWTLEIHFLKYMPNASTYDKGAGSFVTENTVVSNICCA